MTAFLLVASRTRTRMGVASHRGAGLPPAKVPPTVSVGVGGRESRQPRRLRHYFGGSVKLPRLAPDQQLVPCNLGADDLLCRPMKKTPPPCEAIEGQCAGTEVCPLTRVAAGTEVCVKELALAPDMRDRLRELGLCEEQRVKLVSRQSSVICQVCNARVALSEELAKAILVEPLPSKAGNR